MGRKRRSWSKKAEKEYERYEREEAEKEAKARSESEKRRERVKQLWNLLTSGKLMPKDDESENTAGNLKREIEDVFAQFITVQEGKSEKGFRRRDGEHTRQTRFSKEPIRSLVELVNLQDREIEYLMPFRRYWEQIEARYPGRLEHLWFVSQFGRGQVLPGVQLPEAKSKKLWERKRQRYVGPDGVGLIEYQFGGAGEAESRKNSLSSLLGLPYQPTCLDKIFGGGSVKMHKSNGEPGLQDLFGMNRNRLKDLPTEKNDRETWYGYRAVVKMMDRLLENPGEVKLRRVGERGGHGPVILVCEDVC